MHRLLIVDDEPDVLAALQALLTDQEDLELDVLTASSAHEALVILERERLDILLSDICMPGMDGLELLRQVRENWPECRTIFLSGYTEFAYIYQAEQLEAISYLLKTEGRQKILETVRRTIEQINEANRVSQLKQLADQAEADRPYLLRTAMEALIQGDWSAQLTCLLQRLQPELALEAPVSLAIGRMNGTDKPDFAEKARFFLMLEELARRHLGRHFHLLLGETDRWTILFLLQPGTATADPMRQANLMRGSFEVIQTVLLEHAGYCLSFVIDASEHALTSVQSSYEQSKHILDTELRYGAGIRMLVPGAQPGGVLTDEGQAVAMVRSIIEKQYDRTISLTWLAGQVYLNPSYLSRLFRRETGTTLIHYLNQVRMKHACDLLLSTNMKISDIALQTGYESPSYFNQAFKRHVGLSPMQYRQNKTENADIAPYDHQNQTVK